MIAANKRSPIINGGNNGGQRSVVSSDGVGLGLCSSSANQAASLLSADNFDNSNLNGEGTGWDPDLQGT